MEMKINIGRIDGHLAFNAANASGKGATVDGSEEKKGMRPMELLLSALGTCAAMDVVHILKKQKQNIDDFNISVSGTRPDEGQVKPFEHIHIVFSFKGEAEIEKLKRAVELSVEKYCSVKATLSADVKITYETLLN